jgi:hypothetical protein
MRGANSRRPDCYPFLLQFLTAQFSAAINYVPGQGRRLSSMVFLILKNVGPFELNSSRSDLFQPPYLFVVSERT